MRAKDSRPADRAAGDHVGAGSEAIVPSSNRIRTSRTQYVNLIGKPEPDLRTRAKRHDYALLVLAERADGVICSQIYTNLPAAERKVHRTRSRGLSASVTLVRLVSVASTEAELFGGEIR